MGFKGRMVGLAGATRLGITGTVKGSLTATGSSNADALAISDECNVITTTAASTGVILPANLEAGDDIVVANLGASTLSVYPPVGGKINNLSTDGALAVATTKVVRFICIATKTFVAILSA